MQHETGNVETGNVETRSVETRGVETRGVTRWRRSAFLAVPATAAVAAMATAMVQGALAANLSLTSVPFTLSSRTVAAPQGIGAVMHTIDAGGARGPPRSASPRRGSTASASTPSRPSTSP